MGGLVDHEVTTKVSDATDPLLIVVSGAPATGKTTMAKRLSEALRVPVVSKDLIKESLFDTLGAGDREWSKKVGLASIALLFRLIEVQLEVGQSIIAECNFYREFDIPKFRLLKEKYTLRTVEVHCAAERQVLVSRMKHRLSSGERHAGHAESPGVHAEVYAALDRGSFEPLNIGDTLVSVDTTRFESMDYEEVVTEVRSAAMMRNV